MALRIQKGLEGIPTQRPFGHGLLPWVVLVLQELAGLGPKLQA